MSHLYKPGSARVGFFLYFELQMWPLQKMTMKLLTEKELIWSATVANTRMNRERNASGINSYEKELNFQPEQWLRDHIQRYGQVKWLDLCCGQGKALAQCAVDLAAGNLQHHAFLKGMDLIDGFQSVPETVTCLHWETKSVVDWAAEDKYDLITCVHGLHYVGDKLHVLQTACSALSEEGIFLANLDLNNIHIGDVPAGQYIKNIFTKYNFEYNSRKRIITFKGPKKISFGLMYEGANDQVGPNYTGQEAVNSYYRRA